MLYDLVSMSIIRNLPMRYCVGTSQDFLRPTLAQNTESMMGAQMIFRINHIDKMTRKDEVYDRSN